MGNNPLVSAIIIFLNMEQFLEEAIASVLAQTYTHWELLLVDDGSTDGSTAIALRYARTYPGRIRYLEHEEHQNRGMSASRNLGIHYSSGHYIGFLDADDVWLPHKLVEQVALLEANPQAAMIYGRTQIWYSWLAHPDQCRSDYCYDLGVAPDTLVAPPRLLTLLLQNRVQTPTTCNALMRREIVDAVGGFEEHFRGMYEDQAFFAKVELASHVYVADACWARYRQHPTSCSTSAERSADHSAARLAFLTWFESYMRVQGVQHGEVWRALQAEMWPYRHPRLYQLRRRGAALKRRLHALLVRIVRRVMPTLIVKWLRTIRTTW